MYNELNGDKDTTINKGERKENHQEPNNIKVNIASFLIIFYSFQNKTFRTFKNV